MASNSTARDPSTSMNVLEEGRICRDTPTFFFWMTFFEDDLDLRLNFEVRVANLNNQYITWDFLPTRRPRIHYYQPRKEQYRRALLFAKDEIEEMCAVGCWEPKKLTHVNQLRIWVEKIIDEREEALRARDSWFQWFKDNILNLDNEIRYSKEILKIWRMIRNILNSTVQSRMDFLKKNAEYRDRVSK